MPDINLNTLSGNGVAGAGIQGIDPANAHASQLAMTQPGGSYECGAYAIIGAVGAF